MWTRYPTNLFPHNLELNRNYIDIALPFMCRRLHINPNHMRLLTKDEKKCLEKIVADFESLNRHALDMQTRLLIDIARGHICTFSNEKYTLSGSPTLSMDIQKRLELFAIANFYLGQFDVAAKYAGFLAEIYQLGMNTELISSARYFNKLAGIAYIYLNKPQTGIKYLCQSMTPERHHDFSLRELIHICDYLISYKQLYFKRDTYNPITYIKDIVNGVWDKHIHKNPDINLREVKDRYRHILKEHANSMMIEVRHTDVETQQKILEHYHNIFPRERRAQPYAPLSIQSLRV